MVHVTKANFLAQLADFLRHLPAASFVALDGETTGVALPEFRHERPRKAEPPGERYARRGRGAPERYALLRAGVALFHRNPRYCGRRAAPPSPREAEEARAGEGTAAEGEEGSARDEEEPEYTARTYNFHLFPGGDEQGPPEREVTLNPTTVRFLLEHGTDFDRAFRDGVPCAAAARARRLRERHLARHAPAAGDRRGPGGGGRAAPRTPPVALTRADDISFVARTMAGLREWIDADHGADDAAGEGGRAGAAGAGAPAGPAGAGARRDGDAGTDAGAEGTTLALPPCNACLRRCLHETIATEYPGLLAEEAGARIRVLRLSPAGKARRARRRRREAWDAALREIGFGTVFQALSAACRGHAFTAERTARFLDGDSADLAVPAAPGAAGAGRRVPLVVHDGLHDLLFLLTHCHHERLPESFEDAKRVLRGYFPLVWDTRVLATEYSDALVRGGRTRLEGLFDAACREPAARGDPRSPRVPPLADRDAEGPGRAHEAAGDAYMTGCVFHALCRRILCAKNGLHGALTLEGLLRDSSDGLLREWAGANLLYVHMSLYTIDLESAPGIAGLHDPLSKGLSVHTTFHVSRVTKSVSTRDIFQALTLGNESEDAALRLLEYEIIWVDATSFIAGARMVEGLPTHDASTAGLIASHVRNKLYGGLGHVTIVPLGEYFRNKDAATETETAEAVGILESLAALATQPFRLLGSALGFGQKRRSDDAGEGEGDGARKRRKLG